MRCSPVGCAESILFRLGCITLQKVIITYSLRDTAGRKPITNQPELKSGTQLKYNPGETWNIKVITKLPNSEQPYKGKVKTHNYINRQNQSTTGKL